MHCATEKKRKSENRGRWEGEEGRVKWGSEGQWERNGETEGARLQCMEWEIHVLVLYVNVYAHRCACVRVSWRRAHLSYCFFPLPSTSYPTCAGARVRTRVLFALLHARVNISRHVRRRKLVRSRSHACCACTRVCLCACVRARVKACEFS